MLFAGITVSPLLSSYVCQLWSRLYIALLLALQWRLCKSSSSSSSSFSSSLKLERQTCRWRREKRREKERGKQGRRTQYCDVLSLAAIERDSSCSKSAAKWLQNGEAEIWQPWHLPGHRPTKKEVKKQLGKMNSDWCCRRREMISMLLWRNLRYNIN